MSTSEMIQATPNDNTNSRITVVETVYVQPSKGPTLTIGEPYAVWGANSQTFQRFYSIDDKWQPVEFGWVNKCRLLWIRNESKPSLNKSIEVGIGDSIDNITPVDRIGPEETRRTQPVDITRVYLRSCGGSVSVHVVVVP